MRILFLSPQPYFQERGTAIAIALLLEVLSDRGHSVDLLTYHEGKDKDFKNVRIIRISPHLRLRPIPPGFSFKKLYCDSILYWDARKLMKENRYDYIHAVEEASFLAMFLSRKFKTPFVFDMDSSMSDQLVDKYPVFGLVHGFLSWIETWPMRKSSAVVPMCEDLARSAREHCKGFVHVLKDVSLVGGSNNPADEDLRATNSIDGALVLYVGNLESYQGIDLLIGSISDLASRAIDATAVIIGGSDDSIRYYQKVVNDKQLNGRVLFIGKRPLDSLGSYLRQADVLASPRIQGTNTPMKVYSYLDSGVPVVATSLPTHTQVMTEDVACLVDPEPRDFADGIERMLNNPEEARRLANNARRLIELEHSLPAFKRSASHFIDRIEQEIND